MWEAFTNLITQVLTAIYGFCGDWGLSIIILTLIVRLLIMPLMTRSTRSSAKMQVLQPKLQELQERYADDPERLQKEMSKFYAENEFNPLGGCLPVLLQMPIFFALFGVIRSVGDLSGGTASFYNIVPDLTVGPSAVLASSGWAAAAIYIFLDLLFGILTLVPMMLNAGMNSDSQQQSTARTMGIFMAVWMVWIGWGLPSGVLLYYNTSAVWQLAQQQLVTKRVMNQAKAEAEAELQNKPVEIDVVRRDRKKRPHKKG